MFNLSTDQIHAIFIVAIAFAFVILIFLVQGYFENREDQKHKYEPKHRTCKNIYNDDPMDLAHAVFNNHLK